MSLADSLLRCKFEPFADADDVLRRGMKVKRVNFYEGELTLENVSHQEGLLVLRRAGHTSWINRATGSKYAPAALLTCRFWLTPIKGSNRQEVWTRQVMETPVKAVK